MLNKKNILAIPLGILLSSCGGGGSDSTSADNQAPTATISAVTTVSERSSMNLDGANSTDIDGSIVSYQWSIDVGNDPALSISETTASSSVLTVGEIIESKSVTVKLVVTDDKGSTAEDSINIALNEVDFDLLPPDPGQASLDTIEGIDSDSNGVRDDVERAIYELHKESLENRQILNVGAISFQKAIQSTLTIDEQDNDRASETLAKFAYCMSVLSSMDRRKERAILKSLVINTPERESSYETYKQSRHGTIQRVVEATLEECTNLNGQGE